MTRCPDNVAMPTQATRLIALTAAAWIVIAAPAGTLNALCASNSSDARRAYRAIDASDQQAAAPVPPADPRPYLTEPAISPDRSEIAFGSGGDLWSVPVAGGDARLLVAHAANESHPSFSPDGKTLAFVSDRTGGGDIYLLTFATGDLRRLTFDDGNELVDGWSRDGQWIYYTSNSREIAAATSTASEPPAVCRCR